MKWGPQWHTHEHALAIYSTICSKTRDMTLLLGMQHLQRLLTELVDAWLAVAAPWTCRGPCSVRSDTEVKTRLESGLTYDYLHLTGAAALCCIPPCNVQMACQSSLLSHAPAGPSERQ